MAAKFELPEPLAVCIQTALNSGRRLSWKIQESVRGTLARLVWKSDSPSRSLDAPAPLAVTRPRKKSPSQIRRSQRRLQEFLKRKKQLAVSGSVETEARVGITTEAEHPPPASAHTPIKDHLLDSLENQPDCGTLEDVQEVDLATCKSVRFESNDGIPGLRYTLSSGVEKWTPVSKKQKSRVQRVNVLDTGKELGRDVKAAKRVEYKERDRVPGLEIQRGCTMSSVSWIPVIPSPIAYRTRARTNITEGTL